MSHNFVRSLKHHVGNAIRRIQLIYFKSSGVEIGNNTMISIGAKLDVRRGKIIIGNNCLITHGSVILSHDASAMHIHQGSSGEWTTTIGNNVFVGVNSVILPGVTIGDNSVVGAGAVVADSIPAGVVVVGNPARVVRKIERFHANLSDAQ